MGNKKYNILIACEESQRSCNAFRKLGFNAFSCDIQESSGGHPEWHIRGDCLPLLDGSCEFVTEDGKRHKIEGKWDLIIAHPPCTYLSVLNGTVYANLAKKEFGKVQIAARERNRRAAACFFMQFVFCNCPHVCIENPTGFMNSHYRKPDQIIEPYMFGDNERKRTCLWTRGLPLLDYDKNLKAPEPKMYTRKGRPVYFFDMCAMDKEKETGSYANCGKERSKTFPGIAKAFAEQFGNCIKKGDPAGRIRNLHRFVIKK